jgi:23S rRNA pseudouridine1911/1915/1917 synthase
MNEDDLQINNLDNYHKFLVSEKYNGCRIDKIITQNMPLLSRGKVKNLCLAENILLDKKIVTDPAIKVKLNQLITVFIPDEKPILPIQQQIPLNIIFEDDAIIVVNKPVGLTVHPAAGTPDGTLVNGLLYHTNNNLSYFNQTERPGIIHRLDKDTSGVLIVAKNDLVHEHLAKQFFEHTNKRIYYAIIRGCPQKKADTITSFIGRNRHDRKKMAIVGAGGKKAITHYEVIDIVSHKGKSILSLIKCQLETGRTHQIRVHMAHIGHPIIGDPVYGGHDKGLYQFFPKDVLSAIKNFSHQALHAETLGIIHPISKEYCVFTASPPDDFLYLATQCGFFISDLWK